MASVRGCSLGLLLSLCAAALAPVQAQDLTIGVRNGVVRSTVQGDLFHRSLRFEGGQVRTSLQTGLQVTGFLDVPLSDRFSVQVELQYAQKGATVRGRWTGETCGGPLVDCVTPSLNGTYQMSFVQLPVLLTWHQPLGHGISLRMLAGPSLDLLLNTRITTASLHESALPENALTPMSHEAVGAVGGVALQYDVPLAGGLRLGARYHPGLTEINVIGVDSTLRSRAFVLALGYTFRLWVRRSSHFFRLLVSPFMQVVAMRGAPPRPASASVGSGKDADRLLAWETWGNGPPRLATTRDGAPEYTSSERCEDLKVRLNVPLVSQPIAPTMTELRYLPDHDDVTSFTATVEAATDEYVVLDGTYFYPEGGGQPADRGRLEWAEGAADVADVQKEYGDVRHYIENLDGTLPAEGTTAEGHVDEARRMRLKRMHTAQHVLSKIVLDEFGAQTAGNQIHADRSRIDFKPVSFSENNVAFIEERTNAVIEEDPSVKKTNMARAEAEEKTPEGRGLLDLIPDHVDPLRMVKIGDFDLCPCGGTHVDHTRAIGRIRITNRTSKGADVDRIEFELVD